LPDACKGKQGRQGPGNPGQGDPYSFPLPAVLVCHRDPVLHHSALLSPGTGPHTHKQSKSDPEWDCSPHGQRCWCTSCSTNLGTSYSDLVETLLESRAAIKKSPRAKQRNPHKNKTHSSGRERKKPAQAARQGAVAVEPTDSCRYRHLKLCLEVKNGQEQTDALTSVEVRTIRDRARAGGLPGDFSELPMCCSPWHTLHKS